MFDVLSSAAYWAAGDSSFSKLFLQNFKGVFMRDEQVTRVCLTHEASALILRASVSYTIICLFCLFGYLGFFFHLSRLLMIECHQHKNFRGMRLWSKRGINAWWEEGKKHFSSALCFLKKGQNSGTPCCAKTKQSCCLSCLLRRKACRSHGWNKMLVWDCWWKSWASLGRNCVMCRRHDVTVTEQGLTGSLTGFTFGTDVLVWLTEFQLEGSVHWVRCLTFIREELGIVSSKVSLFS